MRKKLWSMKSQMLTGLILLIILNAAILSAILLGFAPSIFSKHLHMAGVTSPAAIAHVTDAYSSAFRIAILVAVLISIVISGCFAWFFIVKITTPIDSATQFAGEIATGAEDLASPAESSFPELNGLLDSLKEMSLNLDLAKAEQSRLLNDLAHELRTPISTVLAMLEALEDLVIKPDDRTWQTIREQLERVNRLSRDLRMVTADPDPFSSVSVEIDPAELATSAHTAWAPRMSVRGVTFELKMEPDLPSIHVDPQRIGQVLSNLLENALRFTSTGGKIVLSVSHNNNEIEYVVQDNGQGISPEDLPHIFERLFRGDPARHSGETGSGLGLTIARTIAENHHGRLIASSQGVGTGARFTLALPINH